MGEKKGRHLVKTSSKSKHILCQKHLMNLMYTSYFLSKKWVDVYLWNTPIGISRISKENSNFWHDRHKTLYKYVNDEIYNLKFSKIVVLQRKLSISLFLKYVAL